MPTSSITEFDELNNETEIIFTAAPEFDEHLNYTATVSVVGYCESQKRIRAH